MNKAEPLVEQLFSTLGDGVLSPAEEKALGLVIADLSLDQQRRHELRNALFAGVQRRCRDPRDRVLVAWLQDVLRLIEPPASEAPVSPSTAFFGPGEDIVAALETFILGTRERLDVAVFTITDNRIARALAVLHRRGVRLRIISDNDKSWDLGSDIASFEDLGIPVCLDRSPHHFHHKFAIRDRQTVLNGSYNWTRSAHRYNRENFMITHERSLVAQYRAEFDLLWSTLRNPEQA